tara:strand:+ start:31 stop:993 length:963 start_codon:yes stop_codon:yes gene_type:complete
MKNLISKLNDENWVNSTNEIEVSLKRELQNGLVKEYRNSFEKNRQNQLNSLRQNFVTKIDINDLDNQLNEYTFGISVINKKVQDYINYNIFNHIKENSSSLFLLYPNTVDLIRHIVTSNSNDEKNTRLFSIFNKVIFESTVQSNKSNAGNAGEEMMDAMLEGIGLKENKGYKKQHKSSSYSDTDFVFPYIKDGNDIGIEVFVAVQFSSNDRFRMVQGELKSGGQAFAVTGNGMSASSKNLDAIGAQILSGMIEKNHSLVCYKKEIERKISELKLSIIKKKKDGSPHNSVKKNEIKLKYYKEYTKSFSDFGVLLRDRFSSN